MTTKDDGMTLVRMGNHYGIEFASTKKYYSNAQQMSDWCREVWGDTDHRTNPNYKWRRRLHSFWFKSEAYRDMFLLKWAEVCTNNFDKWGDE